MSPEKGMIILMGSGELTSTMVEVHKEILGKPGGEKKAVFLDTPAGFQLNADQLSQRAVEYFRVNVQHSMSVASFKSKNIPPFEAERAFRELKKADFVMVGPGSPTYAVRQWQQTPIPEILMKRIEDGSCLVAASAAALTVGRFTLPVYEIYKVGENLHWVEGMDIFKHFGFNLVVIPHWNNAEGGTHDTRYCFMGEARFRTLVSLLPEDVGIIGLDEHTACIMDFEKDNAVIKGIGSVTIRYGGSERIFHRGQRFSLGLLRKRDSEDSWKDESAEYQLQQPAPYKDVGTFWETIHALERSFHEGLDNDPRDATNMLLELDRTIWEAQQDLESSEFISQAREILRELIALLGTRLVAAPDRRADCITPLVEELLALRNSFRNKKQWKEADAIRNCLQRVNITIEDTTEGTRWQLIS